MPLFLGCFSKVLPLCYWEINPEFPVGGWSFVRDGKGRAKNKGLSFPAQSDGGLLISTHVGVRSGCGEA